MKTLGFFFFLSLDVEFDTSFGADSGRIHSKIKDSLYKEDGEVGGKRVVLRHVGMGRLSEMAFILS